MPGIVGQLPGDAVKGHRRVGQVGHELRRISGVHRY